MPVIGRIFVCTRTEVALVELTDEMSQAMTVLESAGVMSDKAAEILMAAQRSGRDVVKFAHHYASLASAVRR